MVAEFEDEKANPEQSFNPGNLRSELTRHASWIQKLALKPILYPVKFGAYTELFAGEWFFLRIG